MAVSALAPPGPAIFLDKDGTLIDDVPWNVDPAAMRLAPGAAAGLARLGASAVTAAMPLVVITNQPGVALGRFAESALIGVRARLAQMMAAAGARLTGFYHCPHAPAPRGAAPHCRCRKPAPGLLLRAAATFGIDLARSWMIGDILDDVEAGRRAGCRTILLDRGNETLWESGPYAQDGHDLQGVQGVQGVQDGARLPLRRPDFVVRDLEAAAITIDLLGRHSAGQRA